jgi:hypothetical protein
VVELSNGMLGQVLSVNRDTSLKPSVLVYDPDVPREDAIILDLAEETEIVITQAPRPATLSADALAYLNPRRRISYHLDPAGGPGRGQK